MKEQKSADAFKLGAFIIVPAGSRPVCAYPQVAKYDGKGDTRDVSSVCRQTNQDQRWKLARDILVGEACLTSSQ